MCKRVISMDFGQGSIVIDEHKNRAIVLKKHSVLDKYLIVYINTDDDAPCPIKWAWKKKSFLEPVQVIKYSLK